MHNTVLIDTSPLGGVSEVLVGIVLYGYRQNDTSDSRVRIATLEVEPSGLEVITTRILFDSEGFDGQSGIYQVVEIDSQSQIHDQLDAESGSGWIEGGRTYSVTSQSVTTLTTNEMLGLSGSIFTVVGIDRTILW